MYERTWSVPVEYFRGKHGFLVKAERFDYSCIKISPPPLLPITGVVDFNIFDVVFVAEGDVE